MSDSVPPSASESTVRSATAKPAESQPKSSDPGFFKVFSGTLISGGFAYLFWRLLSSILNNLPPIKVDGPAISRSIAIGVRYMLVGAIGLMAFMFAVVTVGLAAYTVQIVWTAISGKKGDISAPEIPTDDGGVVAVEEGEPTISIEDAETLSS